MLKFLNIWRLNMKKKIISLLLTAVLAASVALTFAGCGDGDYPVKVANLVIDSEPTNIVVLDPTAADIISFMGYDVKMIARSDEVNQEWLSVVPSIGSAEEPDIDAITEGNADVVFATEDLSSEVKQSLRDRNITLVTMSNAQTQTQLEINYNTIGKILGGETTGAQKAADAYQELLGDMEEIKNAVDASKSSDVLSTVCYLFTEDGQLKMMTSGTYGDMLLGYTGAVNTAVNINDNTVEVATLKVANPNFVFYDSEETLNTIKADSTLSALTAIKNDKSLMITSEEMSRQGKTAIDTLQKMVDFMYPQLASSDSTEATKAEEQSETDVTKAQEQSATEETTATAAAESVKSVADDYGIKLDDKLSLKAEDDNDNVKAMQQRLYDLGYVTDKDNITGYFGEVSEEAVKAFQKNSDIKETGTADNETLTALFSENAAKAK
jgi:iron complex transport system substrate-binding protein